MNEPVLDLILQAPGLAQQALEAFGAALNLPAPQRRGAAARFCGVRADAPTRARIEALAASWRCDTSLVRPQLRLADMRALVMDMDSTIITIECIDELARLAGKGDAVAAITEAAMRGEITDYAQSLRRRVALLAGTGEDVLERVRAERLQFSPGARELIAGARKHGWRTLLVSGGFDVFARYVQQELGIDGCCANRLLLRDGRLSGEVLGPLEHGGRILDAAGKALALRQLCAQLGCDPADAIVIGDGANDLEMMAASGLSIAWRAKPLVRQRADIRLDYAGLDGLFVLFGDAW